MSIRQNTILIVSLFNWWILTADSCVVAQPESSVNNQRELFRTKDADGSGDLSVDEFLTSEPEEKHLRLERDFDIVDFNHDQTLSWDEFRALPGLPFNERGPVPDPVQTWADDRVKAWKELLAHQDKNQDGGLADSEWPNEALRSWGPIGAVPFAVWDVDRNGTVTTAEAANVIDWSYAIRWSNGSQLRSPMSGVVDLLGLANFDTNRDGVLSRAEFVEKYWLGAKKNEEVFVLRDQNRDGQMDWSEILNSPELVNDVLKQFLSRDTNLNGLLDQAELDAKVHAWQKKLAQRLVAAFDDDGDGQLSLAEYRVTPIANLVADWYGSREDHDHDGMLSFAEFYAPASGESPCYAVQFAYEQFRRWDHNHDGKLSSDEYDFAPGKAPPDEFQRRDADSSGDLSIEEYLAGQEQKWHLQLKRNFQVVDFDRSGRLSRDEFRTLPENPISKRGPVPDPVQTWADDRLNAWKELLARQDKNQDGGLSESEWPNEVLRSWGPIGAVPFAVWDVDRNGTVTTAEAAKVIDWSYGIRWSNGSQLRLPMGGVVDLLGLANFDANRDGVLSKAEFVEKFWLGAKKNEEVFALYDQNGNGQMDWSEIMASPELITDALGQFLSCDTNLNGLLDQAELDAKVQAWQKKLAQRLVAAFDDDGDGQLSLAEYRVTPIANLVADWYGPREDHDRDGKLSYAEFYAPATGESPCYAVQFAYEQFRRWDRNHDGTLSSDEYEFTAGKTPSDEFQRRDADNSGDLSIEEFLAGREQKWHSQLKRNFQVVDFDRNGRLSQDEFRTLPESPISKRGPVPDPLQSAADDRVKVWDALLIAHDLNRDHKLAETEWPVKSLNGWGPVGQLSFSVWDVDHDGDVTPTEAKQVINLAYGVSRLNGAPLRLPTGGVVDLLLIAYFDSNKDEFISITEFGEKHGSDPKKATELFKTRDTNHNGRWDWNELLEAPEVVADALGMFLWYDTNLDGFVDQRELNAKVQPWQRQLTRRLVQAFDDDKNGLLSLEEYRITPIANHLANWFIPGQDRDFDKTLSWSEFYEPPSGESRAYLVQLAYEQFRHWDRDHDGELSSDEYEFSVNTENISKVTDPALAFQLADKNHDERLTNDEAFLEPAPDGKNTAAVVEYHRRKMRSEEAFLSADKNRDRSLDLAEYQRYREIIEQVGTKQSSASPTRPVSVGWDWEEVLLYSAIGINVALALVGGLYWAWHRKGR